MVLQVIRLAGVEASSVCRDRSGDGLFEVFSDDEPNRLVAPVMVLFCCPYPRQPRPEPFLMHQILLCLARQRRHQLAETDSAAVTDPHHQDDGPKESVFGTYSYSSRSLLSFPSCFLCISSILFEPPPSLINLWPFHLTI